MTITFMNFPLELQRQVLENLYRPWHLRTEKVSAFSGHSVYTFAASVKPETGPLRTCRSMHRIALELIHDTFEKVLDARSATRPDPNSFADKQVYSIMPQYKCFLPKVTTLLIGGWRALYGMGAIYKERLAGLKTIEVFSIRNPLMEPWHVLCTDSLDDVVTTPIKDVDMINMMLDNYVNFYSIIESSLGTNHEITVRFWQRFKFSGHETEVLTAFDVSSPNVKLLSKAVDAGTGSCEHPYGAG